MTPNRIESHLKTIITKINGNNTLIGGTLICCDSHEFEVRTVGEVKHNLLSGMYLLPVNEKIALDACCRKCGKIISVFDSDQDGYERSGARSHLSAIKKPLFCKKCNNNSFSIEIKYEYPDYQELIDLGITKVDNAFTWIWITLKCDQCGKRYDNFIDYETA